MTKDMVKGEFLNSVSRCTLILSYNFPDMFKLQGGKTVFYISATVPEYRLPGDIRKGEMNVKLSVKLCCRSILCSLNVYCS